MAARCEMADDAILTCKGEVKEGIITLCEAHLAEFNAWLREKRLAELRKEAE